MGICGPRVPLRGPLVSAAANGSWCKRAGNVVGSVAVVCAHLPTGRVPSERKKWTGRFWRTWGGERGSQRRLFIGAFDGKAAAVRSVEHMHMQGASA